MNSTTTRVIVGLSLVIGLLVLYGFVYSWANDLGGSGGWGF